MEVRTNKEYTAMLHEIETVERAIRSREDTILEEMERDESLTGEVASEEKGFHAVEEASRGEATELDARARHPTGEDEWQTGHLAPRLTEVELVG